MEKRTKLLSLIAILVLHFSLTIYKFSYGNAQISGVYFDEENRRQLNIIHRVHAELALDLAHENRKEEARKVLEQADKMMLQENFPYGMTSRGNEHNRLSMFFLQACYAAGDIALADKVVASLLDDLQQQLTYYNALTGDRAENMEYEKSIALEMLQKLKEIGIRLKKLNKTT